MSRTASGTVEWRGNPARWWARITARDEHGKTHRPWVDLERPHLHNTAEGKRAAKRLALKRVKAARNAKFVGVERAVAPKVNGARSARLSARQGDGREGHEVAHGKALRPFSHCKSGIRPRPGLRRQVPRGGRSSNESCGRMIHCDGADDATAVWRRRTLSR